MWNKLEILKLNKTKCNHEIKLEEHVQAQIIQDFFVLFLALQNTLFICFLLLLAMHIY